MFQNRAAKFSEVSDQNRGQSLIVAATDRDVDRFVTHRCDDAPLGPKHPPFVRKGPTDFEVDFEFCLLHYEVVTGTLSNLELESQLIRDPT